MRRGRFNEGCCRAFLEAPVYPEGSGLLVEASSLSDRSVRLPLMSGAQAIDGGMRRLCEAGAVKRVIGRK